MNISHRRKPGLILGRNFTSPQTRLLILERTSDTSPRSTQRVCDRRSWSRYSVVRSMLGPKPPLGDQLCTPINYSHDLFSVPLSSG